MEKFDVKNFDPNLNYVIEASAGTGKTYNVVEIVNKLVNEYGEDLNKILIVTYTDKAAGELKDRIRSKIKDADVDNAPIYTIHSFCKNTIKEFGISANLPLNLNVIDEALLDSFADRYMRTGSMLEDISSLGCFNQYETIKKTLTEGIKKYYLNLSFNEDDSIISLAINKDHQEMFELMSIVNKAKCFEDVLNARSDIKDNYYTLSLSEHQMA